MFQNLPIEINCLIKSFNRKAHPVAKLIHNQLVKSFEGDDIELVFNNRMYLTTKDDHDDLLTHKLNVKVEMINIINNWYKRNHGYTHF